MTNHEHAKEIALMLKRVHAEKENTIDFLISECIVQELNKYLNSTLAFAESTITDQECQAEVESSPFNDTLESIKAEHKKAEEEYMDKYYKYQAQTELLLSIISAETETAKKYEKRRKDYQHLMY